MLLTASTRSLARHHGAVVGQQEGVALLGRGAPAPRRCGHPRFVVGDERQLADPHHVVGVKGRMTLAGASPLQTGEGGQVGAVQVHHGPAVRIVVVDGKVEGHLLGGRSPPRCSPQVDVREPVGAEPSQAGAGRGGDQGAVRQQGGEVAGAPVAYPRFGKGGPSITMVSRSAWFSHGSTPEPCRRSRRSRKLPDLEGQRQGESMARTQGTPGAICGLCGTPDAEGLGDPVSRSRHRR